MKVKPIEKTVSIVVFFAFIVWTITGSKASTSLWYLL